MTISHHEQCFGYGRQNLFGLQLELEDADDGSVAGRFFVKQDHQGPPGFAHGGVLGTALDEAMSLLLHGRGVLALTARLEIELRAPAPVGEFVDVAARLERRDGDRIALAASARGPDGRELARGAGVFVELRQDP